MSNERDEELTDPSHPLYDERKDPTHPLYEGDKADAEHESEQPEQNTYKVGPRNPPKNNRWTKGCPSPNPKGRPKKIQSVNPELKKILEEALFGKVEIKKGNKTVFLTRMAIILQQLVSQAAKGDRHARADIFKYAPVLGVDLQAKEVIADALESNHQTIVDAFLLRRQKASPQAPQDDHVKAPADLVDNDSTKSQSTDAPTKSPQQDRPAEMSAEAIHREQGLPRARGDFSINAARERNLAQQRKNQGGS